MQVFNQRISNHHNHVHGFFYLKYFFFQKLGQDGEAKTFNKNQGCQSWKVMHFVPTLEGAILLKSKHIV